MKMMSKILLFCIVLVTFGLVACTTGPVPNPDLTGDLPVDEVTFERYGMFTMQETARQAVSIKQAGITFTIYNADGTVTFREELPITPQAYATIMEQINAIAISELSENYQETVNIADIGDAKFSFIGPEGNKQITVSPYVPSAHDQVIQVLDALLQPYLQAGWQTYEPDSLLEPAPQNPQDFVPPPGCTSYYDGCNNCMVDENGNAMCTLMACAEYEEPRCLAYDGDSLPEPAPQDFEVPQGCTSYYDGCNTCFIDENGNTACTERACVQYDTPRCTEFDQEYAPDERCDLVGGLWDERDQGCSGILENQCDAIGGDILCLSPCRHDPGAEVCITSCELVCVIN